MPMIYFATNRRPNRKTNPDDFGKDFSEDGLANLRYGFAEVSGDELDQYDIKVAPERLVRDNRVGAVDERRGVLGSKRIMMDIRKEMTEQKRDTVIFIHGYNVTFREALTATARLELNFRSHSGGNGINAVLFSWPSDGSMMPFLAYASDRQDAAASGPAFGRGILKLVNFLQGASPEEECAQCIHLVAHSMGNYVLRHALQTIRGQFAGRLTRVFDQIFMMAADEDDDTFEHAHKLQLLPQMAKRINVYFNAGDVALHVSDKTKGNPDRLGTNGPRLPQQVPAKVTQIDCTPVISGPIEHSYYLDSARVIEDMLQVMAGVPADEISGRRYVPDSNRYRMLHRDT